MLLAVRFAMWLQSSVEDLPPEVIEELPDDVVADLRNGVIDKIPEDVISQLPESVQDRIPESLVDLASTNTGFAVVLAILGVVAVLGFIWAIARSAIKAVVFFGVAAAIAWFLFFQQ